MSARAHRSMARTRLPDGEDWPHGSCDSLSRRAQAKARICCDRQVPAGAGCAGWGFNATYFGASAVEASLLAAAFLVWWCLDEW